jgi:nucleoid DNA-binding protein
MGCFEKLEQEMNRALIVRAIMKDAKVSRRKAELALEALIARVGKASRKSGEVRLGGMGTFVALPSSSRIGMMKKIIAGTARFRRTSRGVTLHHSSKSRLKKTATSSGHAKNLEPNSKQPRAPVFIPNDPFEDEDS